VIVLSLTLLLSVFLCGCYLVIARRLRILDQPNARSSHQRPTPHGGGLPLFAAFALSMACSALYFGPWDDLYVLLTALTLFLVVVGVVDDITRLSIRVRLSIYAACAAAVPVALLPPAGTGLAEILLLLACFFALLWLMNLYNFMDGIDGIAAIQCILASVSAALLSWMKAGNSEYVLICLLLATCHLGFLCWNFPPARLFMGDAGSVPTGFLLGALALVGSSHGQLNPLCWVILLAGFITDTSYTLLWRIVTGQRFIQPHRQHAYQRLSRRLRSHLAVDMGLVALNTLWLFPLAWMAQTWPDCAFLLVILAYLPLLAGMAKLRHMA